MKPLTMMVVLILSVTQALPSTAQTEPAGRTGPDLDRPRLLAGAVAGSAAGALLWWHAGGPYSPSAGSLGLACLTTSLGTALGATLMSSSDSGPRFGSLVVLASFGMIAGLTATAVVARLAGDGGLDLHPGVLLLAFSVGQGGFVSFASR